MRPGKLGPSYEMAAESVKEEEWASFGSKTEVSQQIKANFLTITEEANLLLES